MKTSYRERDYAYGSAMLTLRIAIGLTQKGLANLLGVSRRAVGEWETGNSYPKVEHLKELIALAIQQNAFPAGHEAEEIRALWRATHQKMLLDERWLSVLLSQHSPQTQALRTHVKSVHGGTSDPTIAGQEQAEETTEKTIGDISTMAHPESGPRAPVALMRAPMAMMRAPVALPRVDWDDALAVPAFYGREQELALLSQWVVQERTSLVSVLGMGGIGKSALSVSSMYQLAEDFEVVIFRSLRNAPSCEVLIEECLQVLSPQSVGQSHEESVGTGLVPVSTPASTERCISLLLSHLRKTRTLIVLDNLECLLLEGDVRGHFHPGFEGYGQLLRRVTETVHQSCLLLTSREKPGELRLLESKYSSVRSLRLMGLDAAACKQLLVENELVGTDAELASLIEVYGGNPLALNVVAGTITDLFGGAVCEFLSGGPLILGNITDLLDEQFARLSNLEQGVLRWLAIVREPITLDELLAMQAIPLSRVQALEAIDAGCRRSMVEPGQRPGSFTLQSVMLEYVTTVLISEVTSEIKLGRLDRLVEYSLELACCKEYVRQTQVRLLLSPLLTILQGSYREHGALEERLLGLLEQLRQQADPAQGYGPANLIALLRLLRGHLNGLDLSQLTIRGAYLQGIQMQDTDLSRSLLRDVVFTEDICAPCAVAISPDGKWWAAGGIQGKVHIWQEGGRALHLVWQAHADLVQSLAFSPDGSTLGSGSLDGTIKLWDAENGSLIWTGRQSGPQSLVFSPDANLLASAGLDATVQLWDTQSGTNVQTLKHPDRVFAVAFSPDGRLLASSCYNGEICLWEKQETESSTCIEILSLQTSWVTSPALCLAFAPDGRTLASTSRDRTIRLWEVSSTYPRSTALPEQSDCARCIAWSPDGRTLASSNSDKTIWLWDVEQGRYRTVLHGHTSDIYDMTFTPDSRNLLSGSADNTLRMWDVKTGQCMRGITGYAVSLYDLAWSPDGMQLVSGGSDGRVTIWDLGGGKPSRALHGHSWIVRGVAWSPDGRFIASCGWDTVLYLWDTTTLSRIQKFECSSAILEGLAWSPNGNLLACGTHLGGVQVWDVRAGSLRWVGQTHLVAFSDVSWSPDGTRLACGGDDGCIYLWDGTDGKLLDQLLGCQGKPTSVKWSPDGAQLACGGSSGELFVWNMQNGERIQIFTGHPSAVSAVAWYPYDPYGDRLITGGTDGRLCWWDVQSRQCLSTEAAHQGTIQSLRISPDGKHLASCGNDGAIIIWDLANAKRLQTLRRNRPYERLNIAEVMGLTEAQKITLQTLGAVEETVLPEGSVKKREEDNN